jgi:CxxC motif-containing protein (DUF1111 family)
MRALPAAAATLLALLAPARADLPGHAAATDADPAAPLERGAAEFVQRWVVAPSPFGAWGRGPTSNGEACSDCHAALGRGRPPESSDQPLRSGLLRLSVPGSDARGAPLPHPAYGEQLQFEGVLGKVPAEGEVHLHWRMHIVAFRDSEVAALRRPVIELRDLRFGPIDGAALRSLRIAPPLYASGAIAAIRDEAVLRRAGMQAALGLNGRPNIVWDQAAQRTALGRFGWKANQPSLRQQIASAFVQDLGVTSTLYPLEECPAPQRGCREFPRPAKPELNPMQLDALDAYLRALPAAPGLAHGESARSGERLFAAAGCAGCHAPTLDQTAPVLYSDLLLHDMGEGLSDGRPDYAAGPRDWRTAPLLGLGRDSGPFLHDGRARTLAEAILWHGGEAHPARERFRNMVAADRAALLAFLSSL